MLALAVTLGLYAYSIFFLGILGLLRNEYLLVDTLLFVSLPIYYFRNHTSMNHVRKFVIFLKNDRLSLALFTLVLLQILVNSIGTLGPELAFDALWYHLSLPKIYLANHTIYFIDGNLLYYSAMPQLTEMYYTVALAFHNEIAAKIIHFSFGILTCVALYFLAKQILARRQAALLAVVIFYANLVVGWESITAFSDLSRTFFELMSLWAFINWGKKCSTKWLITSGVLLGFAIATKLLALGTLGIFLLLIFFVLYKKERAFFAISSIRNSLLFTAVSLVTAAPWFLYSLINTGNPVYPFFSKLHLFEVTPAILNPFGLIGEVLKLFVAASDPILPIYLIVLPLAYLVRKKIRFSMQLLFIYSAFALLYWYLLPKIGGGRFIMPYLPAYSILAAFLITSVRKGLLRYSLTILVIILAITSILYRGAANVQYIPVLIGLESKEQFLTKHLNYSFGDFYDTDGYFANTITKNDRVLLYGLHNLYYVNFPFIHDSWAKKGDTFNYIAIQHGELPKKYTKAKLIYKNPVTRVKLYSLGKFVMYE